MRENFIGIVGVLGVIAVGVHLIFQGEYLLSMVLCFFMVMAQYGWGER